jgi:choline dehydrogenase-like flavoprotein
METRRTDVLVIGSGFGAAAPALRLAQAGWSVTMLEKGPKVGPGGEPFRQTQDPKYLLRFLKGLSADHLGLTYAEALGGGSGFYEMVSLRAPTIAFNQVDPAGRPLWPSGVDRAALDPYYDIAERMLRVEQISEHDVPKSGQVFALMMKSLGYSCDRARYAVRNCLGSGYCVTGCIYGAKQSLHVNYLPQAVEAGAEIICEAEALSIAPAPGARRRDGTHGSPRHRYYVHCRIGGESGREVRYLARLVILGGGTVGSARLLLASRDTLPFLSAHLGRNVAFNGSVKAAALLPEGYPDGDMFQGRSHPGMISYEFLESHGITVFAVKPLPVQLIAAARLRLTGGPRRPDWWGEDQVALMRHVRHRMIAIVSLGLTPPAASIHLDAHGTPQLELEATSGLERYEQRIYGLLTSILQRSGCRMVETPAIDHRGMTQEGLYFSTAHQTGSCRMADSPNQGVTNAMGEVFGYPGLYVSDGAAIPSSLAVNTSLTILANAERIAEGIVRRYRGAA